MPPTPGTSPSYDLVSDFADTYRDIKNLLEETKPVFLGRIGGSDTNIVIEYFYESLQTNPDIALKQILPKFHMVRTFNGYYDKADSISNVSRFCNEMKDFYLACPQMFIGGSLFLTEFLPTTINERFHKDTSNVRNSMRAMFDAIGERYRPANSFRTHLLKK